MFPRIALVEAFASGAYVYSGAALPRIGLPAIGAVLRDRGYDCDVWFQCMPGFDESRLGGYDIVGIGSLTNAVPGAYRLADSLRRKGVTVVMGGPHVSFMQEEALDHCDYVVSGEGEVAFADLVDALARGRPAEEVPGVSCRLPDGTVASAPAGPPVDYASLPSPDFLLSTQVSPGRVPPIISTSRGCPHNCIFCCVTGLFGRRYRFKRDEQVIAELRPVLHRSVCFADNNFGAHLPRTKALLARMIDEDAVPLRWSGQITVKAACDLELLNLMRRTRCRIAYIGIESVKASMLASYGKAHDVGAVERCVEALHRHGIGIHGMFVAGIDETPQDVRDIVDYAIAHDIDTIQIFALTPFPGTRVWEDARGRILNHDWGYYDGMHVVVEPRRCSAYEMQTAIVRELGRFYSLRRAVGGWARRRGWRVKYRLGGHYLVRRWAAENASYIEGLRSGTRSGPAEASRPAHAPSAASV
ncbi:MAG: B12-binding domain-containing radical SAM protein [Planctomycetota bacterium]|jgi:radical SAM superfamily enzyme YgiQ (UPF0313 family)